MRLRIVAALILLLVGAGAVYVVVVRPSAGTGTTQYLTGVATTTDVVEDVVATGALGASETYSLAFGSEPQLASGSTGSSGSGGGSGSWLVTSVAVSAGDHVTGGQALAAADTTDAAQQLTLATANLETARARLAVDEAGPTAADRASAYDQVKQAEQSLRQARATQPTTEAQNALKVEQAEAALAAAQAALAADLAAGPSSSLLSADQSAIVQAQQQLDTLQLQIQAATSQAYWTAQQNALKLTAAQDALDAATTGGDPIEIAQAQQALDTLELQVEAANAQASSTAQQNALKLSQTRDTLAAAQAKLAADITAGPTSSLIDGDRAAIAQAQEQLDTLRLQVEASRLQASNQLASAELSLASAKHSYATRVAGATDAQLASDRAAVAQAEAAVAAARTTLDLATIIAPIDGVVTAVAVEVGALAPAGAAIEIQTEALQVTANVAESDRPKLEVDQPAQVTVTALGATVAAHVTAISPTPTSGGQSGVVSYPVTVALDEIVADAAVGMSAEITITISQAQGVVAVPTAAVVTASDGTSTVRVVGSDGTVEVRQVEIGLASRTYVEIRSGVAAGESVVIGTSASRTGTTGGTGDFGGGPIPGGIRP